MDSSAAKDVLAKYDPAIKVIEASAFNVEGIASQSLSRRMTVLIKLAIALSIPNREMAAQCLLEAKEIASDADIAETVFATSGLKSGGATAYGRLVFKYLDPEQHIDDPTDGRTQIQKDRALMTQFRKGSPQGFEAWQLRSSAYPHEALTPKEYELICIACATITQCVYCLEGHGGAARKAGATDREVADTLHLAISARTAATLMEFEAVSHLISK
jgi:AhpD family alkylhydroperoxidase